MELLGLQMQLRNGVADAREQKEIEKRIRALEKELRMD